jgi:hypothetical protein
MVYPPKSQTPPPKLAKSGPSAALTAKRRDGRQKLVDQFLAGRKGNGNRQH